MILIPPYNRGIDIIVRKMNKETEREEILNPLRELYRKDINNRKFIAQYAQYFKQNDVFLSLHKDFWRW